MVQFIKNRFITVTMQGEDGSRNLRWAHFRDLFFCNWNAFQILSRQSCLSYQTLYVLGISAEGAAETPKVLLYLWRNAPMLQPQSVCKTTHTDHRTFTEDTCVCIPVSRVRWEPKSIPVYYWSWAPKFSPILVATYYTIALNFSLRAPHFAAHILKQLVSMFPAKIQ